MSNEAKKKFENNLQQQLKMISSPSLPPVAPDVIPDHKAPPKDTRPRRILPSDGNFDFVSSWIILLQVDP